MIYLLDTTAFSAAMRHEPGIISFLQSRRPGEIATAPPVASEIEYGIKRLDQKSKKYILLKEQKEKLLSVIHVLSWDMQASIYFAKIKADLEEKGTPLDDFDIAIAAIAVSHKATVITANLVHFNRIDGLSSRHWN